MAKKPAPTPETPKTVAVVVLVDCQFGRSGTVAEIPAANVDAHRHLIDPNPAAVAARRA